MNRSTFRLAAAPAAVLLTFSLAACGAANEGTSSSDTASDANTSAETAPAAELSGSIAGAGASSQAAAMETWKAVFESTHGNASVTYDPVGSSGGREQFLSGAVEFAGSDAYLKDEELPLVADRCAGGELIQLPAYISPIAVAYNLEGVDNLQLSPETLAKIFTQDITNWNDPAIAADNPDATLPDLAITAVNRTDGSGTTNNFTDYLAAAAPDVWTHGAVSDWPVSGGTGGQGTSGVVGAIQQANGAIGYADESQIGDLTPAAIKVGDAYVVPSAEAAAKVIDASPRVEGRGEFDFAVNIDRTSTEAGVYPIVLAAYTMTCSKFEDLGDAALVKAFLGFMISEEGQQVAAENAGSAPISDTFRQQAQQAIDAIETE